MDIYIEDLVEILPVLQVFDVEYLADGVPEVEVLQDVDLDDMDLYLYTTSSRTSWNFYSTSNTRKSHMPLSISSSLRTTSLNPSSTRRRLLEVRVLRGPRIRIFGFVDECLNVEDVVFEEIIL